LQGDLEQALARVHGQGKRKRPPDRPSTG